jgi:hypothetical protein
MKYFGYFVTESSGHASEYVPYFRKNAQMVENQLVPRFTDKVNYWFQFGRTGGYLQHSYERLESFRQEFKQIMMNAVRNKSDPRIRLLHHRGNGDESTGSNQRKRSKS